MSNFRGKLTINVHSATKLHDVEIIGKMDPYVKITLDGTTYRTRVHKAGGTNPVWEQSFVFDLEGKESDAILFQVYDEETVSDDLSGFARILISELVMKPKQSYYRLNAKRAGDFAGGLLLLSTSFQGTLPQEMNPPKYIITMAQAPPPAQVGPLPEMPKPVVVLPPPPAPAQPLGGFAENEPPATLGEYVVQNLVGHVLGRATRPQELVYHGTRIDARHISPTNLFLEFLNCGEFTAKGKGNASTVSNEEYVSLMCLGLLGRPANQGDIDVHSRRLREGMDRVKLAQEFADCQEFHDRFRSVVHPTLRPHATVRTRGTFIVHNFITLLLKRPANNGETEYHGGRIDRKEIAADSLFFEFLNCGEFHDVHKKREADLSNEEFVNFLFLAFLGRAADAPGLAHHAGRLNRNEITRPNLAKEFLSCQEFCDHLRLATGYTE